MAKKKHTKIITEPDGTKVELDYSFRAFMDMVINHPPEKAAASIRRSRNAKKMAKKRKMGIIILHLCRQQLLLTH